MPTIDEIGPRDIKIGDDHWTGWAKGLSHGYEKEVVARAFCVIAQREHTFRLSLEQLRQTHGVWNFHGMVEAGYFEFNGEDSTYVPTEKFFGRLERHGRIGLSEGPTTTSPTLMAGRRTTRGLPA